MTRQESEKEIIIPRLKEALARYETRRGEFLIDNTIMAINNILRDYEINNSLRPSQRAFALDLIKNSFTISMGGNK